MLTEIYHSDDTEIFKQKALQWASLHNIACYLDSNNYTDPYSAFDTIIAVDSLDVIKASSGNGFQKLQEFLDRNKGWTFGYLGYDLKNELEELVSENSDYLGFPDIFFFNPRHLITISKQEVKINSENPLAVYLTISDVSINSKQIARPLVIKSRLEKETYVEKVKSLKEHILKGDIYEVNFCQEFYVEEADINPLHTFQSLNRISPTPFASFLKFEENYIISATPERFLSKRGTKLISQPIKGTAPRKANQEEDLQEKIKLRENIKEQSENVMIVDLVRNDLTKSAVPGTVQVEELFGIYSFSQVHQMISTVICEANPSLHLCDLVKNAFPMGSMTGAPKISAMRLIEKFETTKRGVFSGAVGYFSPFGDFDFNVVIRTLLYNSKNQYLSFHTGSAITYECDPEKEYEECLLKAKAIMQVLQ